jgi:hypothetical protein
VQRGILQIENSQEYSKRQDERQMRLKFKQTQKSKAENDAKKI